MKRSGLRRSMATVFTGMLFVLLSAVGAGSVAADSNAGYAGSLGSQNPPPVVPYYPPGYTYPVAPYPYYAPNYAYPPAVAYAPVVAYAPGGCAGYCGYTAAGPIVGYGANGSTLVYDVQGGTIDAYTTDKNGSVCEADSNGNCQQDGTRPRP